MGLFHLKEKIMWQDMYKTYILTPDAYIDTFQNTKKNITNEIVTDKTLNKAVNDFIDAQTSFAKSVVYISTSIAKHTLESFTPKSK